MRRQGLAGRGYLRVGGIQAGIKMGRPELVVRGDQMEHQFCLAQEVLPGQFLQVEGNVLVSLPTGLKGVEAAAEDSLPHLGVDEVPLAQSAPLYQVCPETAAESGKAHLFPGFFGAPGQQDLKIRLP